MPTAGETKITGFRIPDDIINKEKYIAWYERETLTERLLNLLEADIARYEKKNGVITADMISQALKKKKIKG